MVWIPHRNLNCAISKSYAIVPTRLTLLTVSYAPSLPFFSFFICPSDLR